MRSFGAAALLILAALSECLCAQSDRSRSRSPVRSVPVAANVKRDVDFDCPEEFGYYPHPTDCTLYYVCVFGGALLESCTGGLMYSHELQTCDWPRNVGCEGTSAIGGEELERFNDRDPPPPPPPPRRAPPPPPPRAQPNPVVTSRGQPKFNRHEYEKQQQLYAEVDDLPPVEEIETDRQQRVYRGQPATIGQVQKDRDGYAAQPSNSGRTLNSNIIPASLSQNSKIGSFSFGSQVDDRRAAAVTPAPQSYSEDQSDNVTDSLHDRQLDIETNEIDTDEIKDKHSRKKRETIEKDLAGNETNSKSGEISKRNDSGEEMEYIEADDEDTGSSVQDDSERGKRQVRYYVKNGYKTNGKTWSLVKPVKPVELRQPNYNNNGQNRHQQSYNNYDRNNFYEATSRPISSAKYYSTANPFLLYQVENSPSQTHFKPSLPDPSNQKLTHNQHNTGTHIITKSPPISALSNSENLYSSVSGGFYNNAPNNNQFINQLSSNSNANRPIIFQDSSQLPSSVVTGKPVKMHTIPRNQKDNPNPTRNPSLKQKHVKDQPIKSKDYEEEEYSEEQSSEENEDDDDFGPEFPDPPYDFKYPNNKFKDIVNPFANPEFDFDSYLYKISGGDYSSRGAEHNSKPALASSPTKPNTSSQLRIPSSTIDYDGMSTPKPFYSGSTARPIGDVNPSHQISQYNSGLGSTALPVLSSARPSLIPVQQNSKLEQNNFGTHSSSSHNIGHNIGTAVPTLNSLQQKPGYDLVSRPENPAKHRVQYDDLSRPGSTTLPAVSSTASLQYRPQLENISKKHVNLEIPAVSSQRPVVLPSQKTVYEQLNFGQSSTSIPLATSVKPTHNPQNPTSPYEQFLSLTQSVVLPTGLRPTTSNIKQNAQYGPLPTINYNNPEKSSYKLVSSALPDVIIRPSLATQQNNQFQQQQYEQKFNDNIHRPTAQTASVSYDTVTPKLKPPNFNDDRQLPISYSFLRPIETVKSDTREKPKGEIQQVVSVTGKPYNIFLAGTSAPLIVSTPKQQYVKIINDQPNSVSTGKPYFATSAKPENAYGVSKHSTPKPLTTLADEQLAALRQFWNASPTSHVLLHSVTINPTISQNLPKLEKLFSQLLQTTQNPFKNHSTLSNILTNTRPEILSTTAKPPTKRRPIPKPSPEMNDYYYDDDEDEEYYDEPVVKPKYMPSTEIKPQRPLMAQNDKEYDDSYEDDDEDDQPLKIPLQPTRLPVGFSTRKPDTMTKNHNDVSIVTKLPLKDFDKNVKGKIPIPVLVDYASPKPIESRQPELPSYKIVPHDVRNKTIHLRKPVIDGPNTSKPPKFLNQTTLRPYTVRHRLAKPTTVKEPHDEDKQRGKVKHHNIVAQILSTTPRDSFNQETRYTKTKHDDRSNSLEPTESISPTSYSASPRPKMLYNASQAYNQDQYDPFYAVYDEDGELYKDTDYVQQYNTASLRPAVQQTYRGTPPPSRRPVETYTPRPLPDDYDDALIQGPISNQNQYQTPIRHSTRGEGNELGYDHIPSSVRTTLYEATTKFTTPPTTSTSTTTTTKRPTTAPYTEAITPSRNTPRSPTDENPIPESSSTKPSDETTSSIPTTLSPTLNISFLAKPFEKTDNSHRLADTIPTTKRLPTGRRSSQVTNNNVEVVQTKSDRNNQKVVSLTSGFSFRRNSNNTSDPYTLTVITRPFDYDKTERSRRRGSSNRRSQTDRYYYDSSSSEASVRQPVIHPDNKYERSKTSTRRKDVRPQISEEYDIPILIKPTSRTKNSRSRNISTTTPTTTTPQSTTKTSSESIIGSQIVTDQPSLFHDSDEDITDSTENTINSRNLIENPSQNYVDETVSIVSPYKTLDNLRNNYYIDDAAYDQSSSTSTTSSTTPYTTTTRKPIRMRNPNKISRSKPSYYSYQLVEDDVPDQTTEILTDKVKTVIKTFFNNFASSTLPEIIELPSSTTTTTKNTTPIQRNEEEVVNIGYRRKHIAFVDEQPLRNNVKRLEIITEPTNELVTPSIETLSLTELEDISPSTTTMTTMGSSPFVFASLPTTPISIVSSTNDIRSASVQDTYRSKFSSLINSKPSSESSLKFKKFIENVSEQRSDNKITTPLKIDVSENEIPTTPEIHTLSNVDSDVISTTSTTKAMTTVKIEPMTSTTKSISFPTRASRVNPAIKLAASNSGTGRRSYQSSSKCSSDNSLQANPKCNEIKYQRPTSTRGRGSAHYSTSNGSESPQAQPAPNRGTPPTRSRPTLKPSTAIVSETTKFVDIYAQPPSRPAPVYPQPTPDKTAAKCRKDVCLLPDCYCGGKDIPGDLPVEQVPQIVLLTFDDSVNDLNKGLYTDLFEKGRVNPNGCPITATFYVSHEWTDYSQVQNLYSVGHEMASHTVSHSFGEQFSQKKWNREVGGQREILAAYGGVKLEDVRGMRAPFLSVGGNNMFKMLYESNFTYDSSLPVYENKPPSWPYTLDYKIFHDCMIPPCPTKSYPGVWEVPMVMWQDLNGGRCSMGDACANPPEPENVYKMILKNFDRHYTSNRAPFGLFYHAAWFTQAHHKEGFIMFLDFINKLPDVWIVTNWQALQWVRDPTPISRLNNFQPFQCNYPDRPKKCNNPKVCNLWHKSGVRYMRTCQPCPEVYPWTGKSGIRSSRIDNNGE